MVEIWYLVAGATLILMALLGSFVKRLPLTSSMIYLLIGLLYGPLVTGVVRIDALGSAKGLEHLTELAVIVSLFTTGLKLRTPLSDALWRVPVMLATLSMMLTVGLIALAGVYGLGLSWGAAVLLGAVLAPTDPVLASDVQVEHAGDRERLRFSLTGEAGMNDGTAFPFVMLGLWLMNLHAPEANIWHWIAVDLVWAVAGGLAVGALIGTVVGRLVVYFRRKHQEALGLDEFLSLGLIGLSYGIALVAHVYGFLAVLAAGLALRRIERSATGENAPEHELAPNGPTEEIATHHEKAPAYMAHAVLGFNEQFERICEVAMVIVIGAMLLPSSISGSAVWFIPLLLLVIRPVAALPSLWRSGVTRLQSMMICWFGIRGVGSVYYLMYGITNGLEPETARIFIDLTLATIATSIIVHGLSVTPMMKHYLEKNR
ncbi:MAG: sodium:proton antiporter [Deltaproteobacteria bacterium]|nr:sodium:proton antiporter [Deltaproteobacteria bacterium]